MRLCPIQYFVKQKDRSITSFAIGNTSVANHVVNSPRLEPQHLGKLLHIKEPRTVQSGILNLVQHFNSTAHQFASPIQFFSGSAVLSAASPVMQSQVPCQLIALAEPVRGA